VRFADGRTLVLRAGQLSFVAPNSTQIGPVLDFRLSAQIAGSRLVNGFKRRLPSMDKIEAAIDQQESWLRIGRFAMTHLRVEGDQIVDPDTRQEQIEAFNRPTQVFSTNPLIITRKKPGIGRIIPIELPANIASALGAGVTDFSLNLNTRELSLSGQTVTLRNVNFAGGSRVVLASETGILSARPNTGQPPIPGNVNFVRNVTYGGAPAQKFVGQDITIKRR